MIPDSLMVDTVSTVLQHHSPDAVSMTSILPDMVGFDFDVVRILRGLLGMGVLIGIAWLFSTNRKAISWKMVGTGLLIQLVLAIGILYIPFLQSFLK